MLFLLIRIIFKYTIEGGGPLPGIPRRLSTVLDYVVGTVPYQVPYLEVPYGSVPVRTVPGTVRTVPSYR